MKKSLLLIAVMSLITSSVFANGGGHGNYGNKHRPNVHRNPYPVYSHGNRYWHKAKPPHHRPYHRTALNIGGLKIKIR